MNIFRATAFDVFNDYGTGFPLDRMNNTDRMALATAYLAENGEALESLLAEPLRECASDYERGNEHG